MLTLISENERKEKKHPLKYSKVPATQFYIYIRSTGNKISGNPMINILYAKYIYKCAYICMYTKVQLKGQYDRTLLRHRSLFLISASSIAEECLQGKKNEG